MQTSRRNFIRFGLIGGALLASGGTVAASTLTSDMFEIKETDIFIPDLPRSFANYRIGFLSDIHLGVFVPNDWVEEALSKLNKLSVDLLLLGGDHLNIPDTRISKLFWVTRNSAFEDGTEYELADAIYTTLAKLLTVVTPKDGIFSVYGNHDRWTAPKLCKDRLAERNIRVLSNECVELKRGSDLLRLIGVDDFWTGIPRIELPKRRPSKNEIRVVLAHNPDYFSELFKKYYFDFQLGLAGHTHGGQIKLPGLGGFFYNIRDLRFKDGLCVVDQTSIYTTRGIGVVEIPHRINCPPEITVLNLQTA